jgi:hypothetical protein
MYIHMGNEGTNSNEHGEGKEESMNLVETIKSFQKDVLSYKRMEELSLTVFHTQRVNNLQ